MIEVKVLASRTTHAAEIEARDDVPAHEVQAIFLGLMRSGFAFSIHRPLTGDDAGRLLIESPAESAPMVAALVRAGE